MLKKLKEFYFTIDLRSLGLFRILLGGLLINDSCARWPNLEAFYTSFGFLPVESPLPKAGGAYHFSLLDGATSLPMVQFVFALGLVCYVMFLVGFRTRFFHVLSLIFFASVLNRNIMVRHGGDVVMVTMLMWSVFLPLGSRFSVDSVITAMRRGVSLARHGRQRETTGSCRPCLAAFVIILQVGLIYFLTAFAKHGETWKDGTALYYALHIDQLTRPLGMWAANLPLWILKLLSCGTLAVEFAAAPLLLLPVAQPWLRRVAIASLVALHLGIGAAMRIGDFPIVMIATFSLLLSAADWRAIRRLMLRWSRAVTVYYDDTCGFCHRCCQLVGIGDVAGNVRFIGSSDAGARRHSLAREDIETSIVTIDSVTGAKHTKSRAVAAIFRALPLSFHPFRAIALPGVVVLGNVVYDFVARHRYRFSEWLGFTACGMELVKDDSIEGERGRVAPLKAAGDRMLRLVANAAVAAILIVVAVDSYNLNMTGRLKKKEVTKPAWMSALILSTGIEHDWKLFAPNPMKDDGWWVIDGITESGESLDPLTGKPTTFEKPKNVAAQHDRFWRKYLYRLWLKRNLEFRRYFGKYITRRNHREKAEGQRLERFKFYYVRELTLPPGSEQPFPTKRFMLWRHECFEGQPRPVQQKPPLETKAE